jgi:virginiamycin B lyase
MILLASVGATSPAAAEIREFSAGLSAGAQPNAIALGPDGAMWFTEYGTSTIGRIGADGTINEYPPSATTQLPSNADVSALVSGPDGNIWFSEYGTGMIGQLSSSTGQLVGQYPVGPATSHPEGITVGPDGNLWVALRGDRALAQIVTADVSPGTSNGITVFPLSDSDTNYQPVDLTTGPDGALWVTDNLGGVWRVDPANPAPASNEFFVISGNSPEPEGITSADGMLWIDLFGGDGLVELNPTTATSPIVPTLSLPMGVEPLWITAGGDGNLWLTSRSNGELVRVNPSTGIATAVGSSAGVTGDPNTDAVDGAGNVWFTEFDADKIGEVVLALVATQIPELSGDAEPSMTLSCSTGQWSPAADTFSYQWLLDGAVIPGATAASYTLPGDAAGHSFACQVTATQTADLISGAATSSSVVAGAGPTAPSGTPPTTGTSTTPPAPGPPATLRNLVPPSIAGDARESGVLTCEPGTWSVAGASFTYSWYWSGWESLEPQIPPGFRGKVAGPPAGSLRSLQRSALSTLRLVAFADTQQIIVPDLAAPTDFSCAATATVPDQLPVRSDSPQITIDPSPPALARNPKTLTLTPPHINPAVGVSGENVCSAGRWTGNPRFAYTWYQVTADRRAVTGLRYSAVGHGQSYVVAPDDESHQLECWVTATNRYGSRTERSNAYRVPLGAPKLLDQILVHSSTADPDTSGTFGGSFAVVTAETVNLTCLPGHWNRSDLTFTYRWDTDGETSPGTGQQLDFDMRPGNLQYNVEVTCTVTARTSHGVTSVAQSGQVFVSNGCGEEYSLNNTGYADDSNILTQLLVTDYPVFDWLDGLPFGEGGVPHGVATVGYFGFVGFTIVTQGDETPRHAVTFGPNCGNYQRYLAGLGFDVKQDPDDDGQFIIG